MNSYTETFGSWQGYARSGAATGLLPVFAGVDTTAASFAGAGVTDAATTGLGQPQAMRNHKSITRPGSPPRGRLR